MLSKLAPIFLALALCPYSAHAQTPVNNTTKISFSFADGEITSMIATYAKASGKKFLIDPGVRGKATMHLPGEVTLDEAYNLLVDALALNGFTVIESQDFTIVRSARNAQRDLIPVYTTLPPAKPNRMVTMIFTLKHARAEDVNRNLRVLPSKDGELTPNEATNQLIVSDYASNIHRIGEIIEKIDTPQAAKWKPKAREAYQPPPFVNEKAVPRFKPKDSGEN